jgi:hypothetical protein
MSTRPYGGNATEAIFRVALVYSQYTDTDEEITEGLIGSMLADLRLLADQYGVDAEYSLELALEARHQQYTAHGPMRFEMRSGTYANQPQRERNVSE